MQTAGCAKSVDLSALILPLGMLSGAVHSIPFEHLKEDFVSRAGDFFVVPIECASTRHKQLVLKPTKSL